MGQKEISSLCRRTRVDLTGLMFPVDHFDDHECCWQASAVYLTVKKQNDHTCVDDVSSSSFLDRFLARDRSWRGPASMECRLAFAQ